MPNTFLTPSVIAREAMMQLQSNRVWAGLVYRDYAKEFSGKKVGDKVTIRRPATFESKEFTTTTEVQNATESGLDLTIEKHFDITIAVGAKELTLSLQDFSTQILAPAMLAHVEALDAYIASKYVGFNRWAGTAGDPPDAIADLTLIDERLNEMRVPLRNRNAIVNPRAKGDMMTIEQVHKADQRGDQGTALRDASIGRIMGLDWWMNQNVKKHTAGTFAAGSPLVNGAVLAGATTMNIDGGSASETLKKGDLFTVAGVTDAQFVVTADKTASTGAITGVEFYPAAPTGGFADNAAITLVASHTANLAFHPNAIALGFVPLEIPLGAAKAEYIVDDGMAVRAVYAYNASTKTDTISLDFMVGAAVDPRLGCRVLG